MYFPWYCFNMYKTLHTTHQDIDIRNFVIWRNILKSGVAYKSKWRKFWWKTWYFYAFCHCVADNEHKIINFNRKYTGTWNYIITNSYIRFNSLSGGKKRPKHVLKIQKSHKNCVISLTFVCSASHWLKTKIIWTSSN